MPTYTFKHKTTGEERTEILKISEREAFLEQNPDWEQTIKAAPAIGYNDLGTTKPSQAFRDRLKQIKKAYKGSNINTF